MIQPHPMSILTVGHSTYTVERFIELLNGQGVTAVADVRSSPYSRFNPQFNQDALRAALKRASIRYVFLGKELGGRSGDTTCYEGGRIQYGRVAALESFKSGIARVVQGAERYRIALMCAEKEPLECHRTLLIARHLTATGIPVGHILSDGRLEGHDASMMRLLSLLGMPQEDLFRSREVLVAEAIDRQAQKVAYVDEQLRYEESRIVA